MANPIKKKNVQNQPRDRFGRWVAKGANIKWREDGRNKIGIVVSALDGIARVNERNPDGTDTGRAVDVPLDQIQVLASKARIPSGNAPYAGKSDDLQTSLDESDFKSKLETEGTTLISTPSGYSLEVKDDDDTSALTYQLYAPNGQSLGIFSKEALPALQEMIDAAAKPTEDAPDEVVEEGAEEGVPAAPSAELQAKEPKNYRVPPKVKQEIAAALEGTGSTFSGDDLVRAKALAYDDTVSMTDIKWIGAFFNEIDAAERLRGGYNGRKWANKILAPQNASEEFAPLDSGVSYSRYDMDDEVFDYFAVTGSEEDTEAIALIAADYETGAVYIWKDEGFEFQHDIDIDSFEAPSIVPVDIETAAELAKYIDHSVDEHLDILDTDEEERNLFLMAEAELDFEEMDRAYNAMVEFGVTDGIYTPQERSQNAQRQQRGPGGKFGGGQATSSSPAGKATPQFPKAKLNSELPLVENVSARIEEWLATAPEDADGAITASLGFAEPEVAPATPAAPEAAPAPSEEAPVAEETANAEESALYFAIVDEVDKTAVMNAFAIIKKGEGPKAFLRSNGAWAEAPEVLQDIQGTTPPPVVELDTPEPAKTVLAQIDQHDSTQTQEATDSEEQPAVVTASAWEFTDYKRETREKDAKKGYALPDGSFPIHNVQDLKNAVKAFGRASEDKKSQVKAHIRKRAKALNRMDLVPSDWRAASNAELGEQLANQNLLFGEFGEVIVAAGGRRGRGGGAEALKTYWTLGRGAAKIRWGTKGDLTRAHRHLAKYVGLKRAWGLVQNYHKAIFGMSNYKRDNG